MFKKSNFKKPEQVEGIIQKIEVGEVLKGSYLGQSDYRIYTLEVNDKRYDYTLSINDKMEFKEGDNVFFRATKFDKGAKIAHKSLGMKVAIETSQETPAISDDILKKLQQRSDAFKIDEEKLIQEIKRSPKFKV